MVLGREGVSLEMDKMRGRPILEGMLTLNGFFVIVMCTQKKQCELSIKWILPKELHCLNSSLTLELLGDALASFKLLQSGSKCLWSCRRENDQEFIVWLLRRERRLPVLKWICIFRYLAQLIGELLTESLDST